MKNSVVSMPQRSLTLVEVIKLYMDNIVYLKKNCLVKLFFELIVKFEKFHFLKIDLKLIRWLNYNN